MDSGLFCTKQDQEAQLNDKQAAKQDDAFNDNARYSTNTDFNIFNTQLNKSRGGLQLEVSQEQPKL